jgi:hypothetical protein
MAARARGGPGGIQRVDSSQGRRCVYGGVDPVRVGKWSGESVGCFALSLPTSTIEHVSCQNGEIYVRQITEMVCVNFCCREHDRPVH